MYLVTPFITVQIIENVYPGKYDYKLMQLVVKPIKFVV